MNLLRTCLVVAACIACLAGGACSVRPEITDTGFVGTWARSGIIGNYRSSVAILREGDRYLFRWRLDSEDGKWRVRCGWDGKCDEFLDGKKIGAYTFLVQQEPGKDFLSVDCTRTALREGDRSYHYIDELVLDPGGKSITSYTLRLGDETFTRESTRKLVLEKISDTVADPPPGVRS